MHDRWRENRRRWPSTLRGRTARRLEASTSLYSIYDRCLTCPYPFISDVMLQFDDSCGDDAQFNRERLAEFPMRDNSSRHSGRREAAIRNLEIPGLALRAIPE